MPCYGCISFSDMPIYPWNTKMSRIVWHCFLTRDVGIMLRFAKERIFLEDPMCQISIATWVFIDMDLLESRVAKNPSVYHQFPHENSHSGGISGFLGQAIGRPWNQSTSPVEVLSTWHHGYKKATNPSIRRFERHIFFKMTDSCFWGPCEQCQKPFCCCLMINMIKCRGTHYHPLQSGEFPIGCTSIPMIPLQTSDSFGKYLAHLWEIRI